MDLLSQVSMLTINIHSPNLENSMQKKKKYPGLTISQVFWNKIRDQIHQSYGLKRVKEINKKNMLYHSMDHQLHLLKRSRNQRKSWGMQLKILVIQY